MQENNFEKQVKEKMEALNIPPSGDVWQKVSGRIGGRRRDDRLLFAVAFALLVLVGGVTWWYSSSNHDSIPAVADKQAAPTGQIETDSIKNNTVIQEDKNQRDIVKTDQANSVSNLPQTPGRGTRASVDTRSVLRATVTNPDRSTREMARAQLTTANLRKKKDFRGQSRAKTFVSVLAGAEDAINDSLSTINQLPVQDELGQEQVFAGERNFNDVGLPNGSQKFLADPERIYPTRVKSVGIPVDAQHPLALKLNGKKRQAWNVGVNLSAGIATTRNGYLGIVANSNDENKDYAQMPTNSTGNSGTPTNSVIYRQSPVRLNTGFTGGIFLQRQLGARTALVIGIHYKYYSTKMTIGNRVDSSGLGQGYSSFYRAGIQNEYINRYHFMELPVGVQFRITGQRQRPVYIYTGVTIAKLLGTNALQFNNLSNSYYNDNSVFTKTQFDASAKLLFALSRRNPNGILAGPHLNFGLGKMAVEGIYKNRNYSYLGITLQKNIY